MQLIKLIDRSYFQDLVILNFLIFHKLRKNKKIIRKLTRAHHFDFWQTPDALSSRRHFEKAAPPKMSSLYTAPKVLESTCDLASREIAHTK